MSAADEFNIASLLILNSVVLRQANVTLENPENIVIYVLWPSDLALRHRRLTAAAIFYLRMGLGFIRTKIIRIYAKLFLEFRVDSPLFHGKYNYSMVSSRPDVLGELSYSVHIWRLYLIRL